tara:strand:+ start:237 stop:608 length:372 start_codon:yes stop_codon:yes gene_type:complete
MIYKEIIEKVLSRHQDNQPNLASEAAREVLATEIAAVLISELSNTDSVDNWEAKDNPLGLHMWKGFDGTGEELDPAYLEHWTCDHCGKHTHEVEYDYLGNGTNHLQCELELENNSEQLELELN